MIRAIKRNMARNANKGNKNLRIKFVEMFNPKFNYDKKHIKSCEFIANQNKIQSYYNSNNKIQKLSCIQKLLKLLKR